MARVKAVADAPAVSPAVAAEPLGIGTAGARDPLAVEVRLLGRAARPGHHRAGRTRAVRARRARSGGGRSRCGAPTIRSSASVSTRSSRGLDLGAAEAVIGAFALYFGLVNLAEARGRVRALRRRERAARDGVLDDSVADAVAGLRRLGRTRRRAGRADRAGSRSRRS